MSFLTRTITTTQIECDACGATAERKGDREQVREELEMEGWATTESPGRRSDWCPRHGPARAKLTPEQRLLRELTDVAAAERKAWRDAR